ncbi:MAG: AsmA-like C-terminal region-containing protein, partial [Hyphomicrobium sp.]
AWQGERTSFNGKVSPIKMVLEEKPARLEFTAENRHISANYEGEVHVHDGADLEGKISAKSQSVKALAKWLGTAMPNVAGFGPLSIAGDLKTSGNVTTLANATIGLDGATAKGNATVTTGGIRPHVQTNLQLSELDLNKYMAAAGGAPAAAAPDPVPKPAAKLKPAAPAKDGGSIEELLNEPASGAKVHGYEQRAGWSSEPINMTLFGVADIDAKLRVGSLLFQEIKVGQSALTVALKNKVLKTSFDNVQLYDGQGKGFLNVDGTGKAATIGANFTLDGLSALPFLKDAADMEWLAGKTRLALQLATQGSSQLQMVEALNGKADFAFADGVIVGFNVPGAIRNVSQGKFSGLKKAPSEKTDFSELAASFTITNGVAQNQDLRLTSPLLRVTGTGAVQLPERTLDYTVKPKIVASLEGQQGAANLAGLEIPVRISGPWDKPKYEPDLKGIDTKQVVDTVKQIGKQFKGKSAKEIANELLGNKKNPDGTTSSTSKQAKDLLNKFLKPQ